jgi:lipoate-protein ligase A
MTTWDTRRLTGTVQELHSVSPQVLSLGARPHRLVQVLQPVDSAVVLGSTQSEQAVDRAAVTAAGTAVVRRRSGGSAVLVEPGSLLWVDLFLPAGDPLWDADVGRACWWVGEAWERALAACGLTGLEVWRGPMLARPWSALVCFAGLGAGEVTIRGGRKVVGIAQRRGRAGALFQCACLLTWEPARLLRLLAMEATERQVAGSELAEVASGTGAASGEEILGRLLEALPA